MSPGHGRNPSGSGKCRNNMITTHPPLKRGEKFIGNMTSPELPDYLKNVSGFSFRQPAYDLNGSLIPDHWALIADAAGTEAHERIMMQRFHAINRGIAFGLHTP